MVRVRVVDGLIADVIATVERAPELARALELALPGTLHRVVSATLTSF